MRHLIVDDATVFAFDGLTQPYHLLYVSDATVWGSDRRGKANAKLLRDLGASGLIARCTWYPPALVPYTQWGDGYCCVSGADIERAATE